MHRKWLCIPAALLCLLAQPSAARNIFVTPGDAASSGVSTFTVDPFSFVRTFEAGSGAFAVIGTSDPNKHYILTRNSADSLLVTEGRFPVNIAVTRRLTVGGTPAAAALTADGRYLAVVGNPGIAILDTTTDQVISLMGNIDVGGEAVDVAADIVNSRVYVLSSATSRLTAVDVPNRIGAGTVALPSRPHAVTMGPNGVLYVSAAGAIYEVDAQTMTIRATISTPIHKVCV